MLQESTRQNESNSTFSPIKTKTTTPTRYDKDGAVATHDTNVPTSTPPRRGGRQKQELNHLLGFTLTPRATPQQHHHPNARRSAKRNPTYGVYDKQKYVHQQFRFVLRPDKDYTAHFADPDIHFDWPDILQVIVPTRSALSSATTSTIDQATTDHGQHGAVPTCPICLSEPTAPRMAKCGHVFCFPCMLHYLELADGTKWRRCPICWDAIHAKDLKSVHWYDPVANTSPPSPALVPVKVDEQANQNERKADEPLKLRLVRRPQISTLALPRSDSWPSDAVPPLQAPWTFTPDAFQFAKFMLGPPEYIKEELEHDLRELEQEIATLTRWSKMGGSDEELGIVFVRSAINKVQDQIEKALALKTHAVMTARKQALRELQDVEATAKDRLKKQQSLALPIVTEASSSELEDEVAPHEYLSARSSALSSGAAPFAPKSTTPGLDHVKAKPARRNVNPVTATDTDSAYYFYQAASGQNIFLQPLDIRILKSHFGSYEGMPNTIQVMVEGSDEGSMNDELRRRCRWLSHLPAASDVVFIETDLTAVVSKEALEPYMHALKQRRNKRRDRARREDRAKAKSDAAAAAAAATPHSSTHSHPVFIGGTRTNDTRHDHASSSSPTTYTFSQSYIDSQSDFPPPAASTSPQPPSPMLARTNAAMSESPPNASRTAAVSGAWGTPARSFAAALHSSSRDDQTSTNANNDFFDPELDERWHDFEEDILRSGGSGGRRLTSTAGPLAGPNAQGPGRATKKAKPKKLVLTMGGRGSA